MPRDGVEGFATTKAAVLSALPTRSVGAVTGLLAAITDAHSLSPSERERLVSAYGSIGSFLKEDPQFQDVAVRVHVQGSMLIGTTTRPEGKSEMDVDLVLLLIRGLEHRVPCTTLLNALYASLEIYAKRHDLAATRKCRCVQLQYTGQMHADVTPVIWSPRPHLHGQHHGLVPDRELTAYNGTNPEGYGFWFADAASRVPSFSLRRELETMAKAELSPLPPLAVFDRLLSRIIQAFKIHRNIMFRNEPALAPTSTFITTLGTKAYIAACSQSFSSPLDLIFHIWSEMPRWIEVEYTHAGPEWIVLNPTAPEDNLAHRMNSAERQAAFRKWHERFGGDLLRLLELHLGAPPQLDDLTKSVTKSFGERASRGVTNGIRAAVDSQRSRSIVILPGAAAAPLILESTPHRFFGRGH